MRLTSSNLKTIKVKNPYHQHKDIYKDDCNRIQAALMDHGYYATIEQCVELWELHSEEWAAGWLSVPQCGEDIFKEIKPYFEAVE
jgi:hypothetical protein